MNLVNFLEDSYLNSVRKVMDAPLSTYQAKIELPKAIFPPRISPAIVLPLPTEGLDVAGSEIQTLKDGTLAYKGNRVLVHIRDATTHQPRFHLANCSTLTDMKSQGKFEKYVVSKNTDGHFQIRMNGGSLVWEKLQVCQNCLDKLAWDGFSKEAMPKAKKQLIVRRFSITGFFEKYPTSLHPSVPTHTAETAPKNDYPQNWSEIAGELKRQLGYYCQGCKLVVGEANKRFLHVHHINGLRNDCRPENLKCLCIACHSDQHMHGHLKSSSDYNEFKKIFP